MTELPPPPPMTSEEIVGHLRDHWLKNIRADVLEAEMQAERGFMHLLQNCAIREWGFDKSGNTLYEPGPPIVFVLLNREEP